MHSPTGMSEAKLTTRVNTIGALEPNCDVDNSVSFQMTQKITYSHATNAVHDAVLRGERAIIIP